MSVAWQDHETDRRTKRLSQSQPLRVDWLVFWTVVATGLVGAATASALIWLGRLAWRLL